MKQEIKNFVWSRAYFATRFIGAARGMARKYKPYNKTSIYPRQQGCAYPDARPVF